MKQLFTLLTLGLLCGNAAFAAFTPPCTLAIDSPEAFAQWTTANPNGDDYTFEYASDGTTGYALYTQNKNGAANDWLITPAITLANLQNHIFGRKQDNILFRQTGLHSLCRSECGSGRADYQSICCSRLTKRQS